MRTVSNDDPKEADPLHGHVPKEGRNRTVLRRLALPLLPAAALVLEALPFGVRMVFAPGPETRAVTFHAFFSFLPFGYGVFGPVIAALLTVFLLIAALLTRKQARTPGVTVLSAAALLAAVSPLFYVPDTFTVCGGLICVLLALELASSLLPERKAD